MLINGFANWLLVFARVGALLAVVPMFAASNVPVRLRIALSGMIALLLTPFLPALTLESSSIGSLVRFLFAELSVGLLLGFVCRIVFFALEAAGALIATEMGLMMTAEFNPFSGSQSSALSMVLYWMALMIWFSLDLHHWMIVALQRSYALVPVGGIHLSEALLNDVIGRSASIFLVALQISAPVMGVSFVLALVFSLLGRSVPQMNVFSESFPIRTLVGLVVFGSTSLFMAQHIANCLRRLPEDLVKVMQLLGTG